MQGRHSLVYDMNQAHETWEWVDLKEVNISNVSCCLWYSFTNQILVGIFSAAIVHSMLVKEKYQTA